jgi:mono/diheme cytochrome c family protein
MCHQADGHGSPQVGTPNFALPDGPLQQSFDDLVRRVQEGKGDIMPAFGNSLPLQDIRNVVAYIREAFGGRSGPARGAKGNEP